MYLNLILVELKKKITINLQILIDFLIIILYSKKVYVYKNI